jgi:thymidylate synthase
MVKSQKHPEYQYLDLISDIFENGTNKKVYGAETYIKSVFGRQIRFNLSEGFPLLTTKKVYLRAVVYELLWFLKGDSNIKYLVDNNIRIWNEWAYKGYTEEMDKQKASKMTQEEFVDKIKKDDAFAEKWGELGGVYGAQWRKWQTSDGRSIDQIDWVLDKLKTTPYRKHLVVSAWNPELIYEMAAPGKNMVLPPCHTLFHFNVSDNKLSLQLYQRSADLFLGVPFNIASYSLLLLIFAHLSGLEPGEFVHTFGDVHIYSNHFDQCKEQISRTPRPFPVMKIDPDVSSIDKLTYEHFSLEGYDPHPPIKADITVVGGFDKKK